MICNVKVQDRVLFKLKIPDSNWYNDNNAKVISDNDPKLNGITTIIQSH